MAAPPPLSARRGPAPPLPAAGQSGPAVPHLPAAPHPPAPPSPNGVRGVAARTPCAPHPAASRPQPHLHHGPGPRSSSRAAARARLRRGREAAGARQVRHNPAPRHVTPPPRWTTWPRAGTDLKGAGTPPAAPTNTWSPTLPLSRCSTQHTQNSRAEKSHFLFRLLCPAGHFQRILVQEGAQSQSLGTQLSSSARKSTVGPLRQEENATSPP